MGGREPTSEFDGVTVSRLTVATAVDLLRDAEHELEQTGATGPYLDEVSETIDELEESL